ncbi:uncharacterized protein [Glycine max]|uniref:uncharacterized protein isoform X2 n=1 Tax=Glycine max TaxID=3847 RepID=UPI000233BE8B|nr:uncharacterized protein LOC100779272 isoform X2 [Glycine max]|eukprot:XP_014623867.1 uncharacterized protein LOC100779272 isoform X2 [Glycine max]
MTFFLTAPKSSMHLSVANFLFPTSLKDYSLLEVETCLKALEALEITRMNFLALVKQFQNSVASIHTYSCLRVKLT